MTDIEIHKKFVKFGKEAREAQRECAFLLPIISANRIWEKKGFGSIFEYAAKLAGMSPSSVKDALWVLKKIVDKPSLQEVVKRRGVQRVKPVANIATVEDQEMWAEKAMSMSRNTLRMFVREIRDNSWAGPRSQADELDVTLTLKLELASRLKEFAKREDFEERLEKMMNETEKPKPVRTKSRHIPVEIKRHVIERSGGKCAFPACMKDYEILHHTQRFALEKVHDPDRLVPLCKGHERLAHHGLIANEELSPYTWKIRTKPDMNSRAFWIDQHVALYRPG